MTTSFAPLTVAIGDLTAHPANVRSNAPETYDPENIAHLKASIAVLGLLQPLLVQKLDGKYAVLAGGRRHAALKELIADKATKGFTIRPDQDTQRLSVPTRIGVRHPKLSQVIQMMEQNIEEPISPAVLAKDVGMSTRQLERLFRRYLNRSPKRYYMELRLQKARNLLMQTDMSVINVALACGFASPSHFSKCYRAHYETTPYRERGSHASMLNP